MYSQECTSCCCQLLTLHFVSFHFSELCEDYCINYFDWCANWNIYLYPERKTAAVNGITTTEPDLPRTENAQRLAAARTDCLETCMTWPRPTDPLKFESGAGTNIFNSRLGGDTIWCRMTHLSLAQDPNTSGFHCGHGTNPALGICRDALVDGFTPYEWLRDGADTQHRQPYCDFANEGKVADCTLGGIDDSNLETVLRLLPGTVRILFLNGNDITTLPDGVFMQYVPNYAILKAIYINDNGLTTVGANALQGLAELEVFNADENNVASLADNFLMHTPKLKQFSMFHNDNLFSGAGQIPTAFFSYTPLLEVMSLYGTGIINFQMGVFDGLTKLTMMSFVTNQAINTASFAQPYDQLFGDLTSLRFFDFFGTTIGEIPENFFGPWASNILRLAFWNCPINNIHPNAGLGNLQSIEMAYFHWISGDPSFTNPASFNIVPVADALRTINPLVTLTYGEVPNHLPINPVEPQPFGREL